MKPTEKRIFEDSLIIFDFFVNKVKFKAENIIIFGRSIGTGPASYLASKRENFMLVLFSPFSNFKKLVHDKVNFLNIFVSNRFENDKHIKNVRSPIFILHGKIDKIINFSHSQHLFALCKNKLKILKTPERMTHNNFNLNTDLLIPLKKFVKNIKQDNLKKETEINNFLSKKKESIKDKKKPLLFLISTIKHKTKNIK